MAKIASSGDFGHGRKSTNMRKNSEMDSCLFLNFSAISSNRWIAEIRQNGQLSFMTNFRNFEQQIYTMRALVASRLANMHRGDYHGNQYQEVSANLRIPKISQPEAAIQARINTRSGNPQICGMAQSSRKRA